MYLHNYGRQNLNTNDFRAVLKTLKSDFLTQGPEIDCFEEALAKYVGVKYAVVVANGTVALHLAYQVLGLKPGEEIITTANTFVATSNAALYLGAKPVFADIELKTYNLDPAEIEKKITRKTKIIVPVHFAGHACDMKKIRQIAKKYNLKVVEDASHALGGSYFGKKIGQGQSDLTVFSFHPVKPITTGEGGAILTNRKDLYQDLKLLRQHGIHKNKEGWIVMTKLGYNYRLTDLQASLGRSQLRRVDEFISRRKKIVSWYRQELAGIKEIILPQEIKGTSSAWHLYVIRAKNKKLRDRLKKFLEQKKVGVNFHYPPVYSHPYYRQNGYSKISLPNAETYARTCLTLPLHTLLSQQDIHLVGRYIKQVVNSSS